MPKTSTPNSVPNTYPTPPVSIVPPMTTEAITSSSKQCVYKHFGRIDWKTHQASGLLVSSFITSNGIHCTAKPRVVGYVYRHGKDNQRHDDEEGDKIPFFSN